MKGRDQMSEKKQKGFTIIEVVLVLAIAGLIFLMVFLALPALQRSQRDTQRKQDISRILTQLNSYTSNNRGSIPATLNTAAIVGGKSFVQNYLGGTAAGTSGPDYLDPQTGAGYTFDNVNTTPTVAGHIGYGNSKICGTDGAFTATGATARNYALAIVLESQKVPYCVDNR